jgi:hypothetical protein
MSSTATTNTLEITVAASPITTAAILDAVKGTGEKKQQVKQLKNKMEKTKKNLIENTNLSFTTVNEIYSQATLLLQSAISPENNSSEKELSSRLSLQRAPVNFGTINLNLSQSFLLSFS